mmetsp:Transcript_70443/g.182712  ORF Transcript_70443/g.182712 Transcript_70443/m.182712 type:complete len:767 (+) Transcript_70443:128-2428(+)
MARPLQRRAPPALNSGRARFNSLLLSATLVVSSVARVGGESEDEASGIAILAILGWTILGMAVFAVAEGICREKWGKFGWTNVRLWNGKKMSWPTFQRLGNPWYAAFRQRNSRQIQFERFTPSRYYQRSASLLQAQGSRRKVREAMSEVTQALEGLSQDELAKCVKNMEQMEDPRSALKETECGTIMRKMRGPIQNVENHQEKKEANEAKEAKKAADEIDEVERRIHNCRQHLEENHKALRNLKHYIPTIIELTGGDTDLLDTLVEVLPSIDTDKPSLLENTRHDFGRNDPKWNHLEAMQEQLLQWDTESLDELDAWDQGKLSRDDPRRTRFGTRFLRVLSLDYKLSRDFETALRPPMGKHRGHLADTLAGCEKMIPGLFLIAGAYSHELELFNLALREESITWWQYEDLDMVLTVLRSLEDVAEQSDTRGKNKGVSEVIHDCMFSATNLDLVHMNILARMSQLGYVWDDLHDEAKFAKLTKVFQTKFKRDLADLREATRQTLRKAHSYFLLYMLYKESKYQLLDMLETVWEVKVEPRLRAEREQQDRAEAEVQRIFDDADARDQQRAIMREKVGALETVTTKLTGHCPHQKREPDSVLADTEEECFTECEAELVYNPDFDLGHPGRWLYCCEFNQGLSRPCRIYLDYDQERTPTTNDWKVWATKQVGKGVPSMGNPVLIITREGELDQASLLEEHSAADYGLQPEEIFAEQQQPADAPPHRPRRGRHGGDNSRLEHEEVGAPLLQTAGGSCAQDVPIDSQETCED